MAAPEVEVPDFDDGQKAVESFRALCEAVADANAAMAASGEAGSSIYPQPAPEPPGAPPPAAPPPVAPPTAAPSPPAAEWADEPQLTPQQPSAPPPWWDWRQRQQDDAWQQQAEEAQAWQTQAWQESGYYTAAAREPVSSEISHWNCVRVGITKHPGGPWEVMFKIRPML